MTERRITPAVVAKTLKSGIRKISFETQTVYCTYKGVTLVLKGKNCLITVYRKPEEDLRVLRQEGRQARVCYRKKREAMVLEENMKNCRQWNYLNSYGMN